jgi:hypothetical protein
MFPMAVLIAGVATLLVVVGSVTLGRWMQRKGRDIEKGGKDAPR